MINRNKVVSVYSGRKGCCCGCRGNHSYASQYADQRSDYYAENGVNDRTVTFICNRVEELLRDRNAPVARVMIDPDFIAIDLKHDRTYTVYFAEGENADI